MPAPVPRSSRRPLRAVATAASLAALLLAACGDGGPTRPLPERVASLSLAPDTLDVPRPGGSGALEVTARDTSGRRLAVRADELSWAVDDTLTARVGPDGALTARAPGRARVTARLGGAADTVLARVLPGGTVEIAAGGEPLRTWPGDTASAAAAVRDASGSAVEGAAVRWGVLDTVRAVAARFGPATAVVGRRAGRTRLVASIEHDADTAEVTVATEITGTVRALGGGVPAGTHVFLRRPGPRGGGSVRLDSAAVRAGGAFSIRAERPLTGVAVDLWIDQRTDGARTHLPSAWHDVPLDPAFRVDALLVPASWTIRDGELAGRRVGVSLQRIFAYPNPWDHGNYWAVWKENWTAWRGQRRGGGTPSRAPSVAWPDSAFPIPVYFRRGGSSTWLPGEPRPRLPVSAEDSAAFWANVDRMEERVGRDLFRPARARELPPDTVPGDPLEVRYAVRVEVLSMDARGAATVFLDSPAYPASDLIGAFVAIRGTDRFDTSTVPHELVHALGYYHACFPSAVVDCDGPYPYRSLPTVTSDVQPTGYDVAYMELLRAAHRELLRRAPNFGLVAALNGERVHLLGLDPVSEGWLGGPAPVSRRPIR